MIVQRDPLQPQPAPIRLMIADVDGTLVTPQKELTQRSIAAVHKLHAAGIGFAVTSGRPPRGMRMLVEPLDIRTCIAAFNGGMLVRPDLSLIEQHVLPAHPAELVTRHMDQCGLNVWVYRGNDWFVRQRHGPHVDREEHTVQFEPTVVSGFDGLLDGAAKIVGVSNDYDLVVGCETELRRQFGEHVSASRSQPYYLDVTHPLANKGTVVRRLSQLLHVAPEQIASIGDMPNDVLMFALTGVSIAMGNATPEVQRAARYVTASNAEEGFALAVERYVLRQQEATRQRGDEATRPERIEAKE